MIISDCGRMEIGKWYFLWKLKKIATQDKNLNPCLDIQKCFDILGVTLSVGKGDGSCWVTSSVDYESARVSSSTQNVGV